MPVSASAATITGRHDGRRWTGLAAAATPTLLECVTFRFRGHFASATG